MEIVNGIAGGKLSLSESGEKLKAKAFDFHNGQFAIAFFDLHGGKQWLLYRFGVTMQKGILLKPVRE